MHTSRRIGRLLLLAGSLLCAGPGAHAQFSLINPQSQSVMSSRDFNALMDAIGFDAAQRSTAGPLFDDAQLQMIAARDEMGDAAPPRRDADDKALSEHESRVRRSYERMRAAERTFYEGLAALARADQAALLERERLASTRRLVRRTLGADLGMQGPARVDLVASVLESRLSPEQQARALAALTGYQAQLTALLEQALDHGLSVNAKAAKLREAGGTQPATSAPDGPDISILTDDPLRRQASQALNADLDKLALLHQQAMQALDGALTPMEADPMKAAAARKIWPRAAMDPRSPRATFAQLRAEIAKGKRPSEQLAALDAAQPAWLSAWWSATRKACDAENTLRKYGPFGGPREETQAARDAIKGAREEREQANRAAWRALAAVDTAHAEFYAPLVNPPQPSGDPMAMAGPHEPTPPSLDPEGAARAQAGQTFSGAVIMVASRTSDGDGPEETETMEMPLIFEAGGPDQPISISMGPDGVATLVSDSVGDGMSGGSLGMSLEGPPNPSSQLSGARMPRPIVREQAMEYAKVLGGAAVPAAMLDQLYSGYAARVGALDDSAGAAVKAQLSGPPAGVSFTFRGKDGTEEAPQPRTPAELRTGITRLDEYVSQLATLDDAFLNDLRSALASASDPSTAGAHPIQAALSEERARDRLRQLRYPTSPMLMGASRAASGWDLAAIVRQASLSGADAATAATVLAEWSPSAVAAMEQGRATLRRLSLDLVEAERKMFQAAETVSESADGSVSRNRTRTSRVEDPAEIDAHRKLMDEAAKAMAAGTKLAKQAHERLDSQLSAQGRAAFLAAWCRAVAPQAFDDHRNADARLTQALAFTDLTDDQRRQVEALRASHAREHSQITERIGVLAAESSVAEPAASSPKLERLRFDRAELNERTLRRLRALLTAVQGERLLPLGSAPAKAKVEIPG